MDVVAIVGKPNVGKSTLFNRIIQNKKSIVDDAPGVTRDRIYGYGKWLTREFQLIDTGGFSTKNATLQKNINDQVQIAIEEAQTIIFLISCKNGIDKDDIYIAKLLKKIAKNKNIILAANKCESFKEKDNFFYNLGFGNPILISSAHGIGIGDLLDNVIKKFKNKIIQKKDHTTFCIIGRPNVGKSSLVNCILNEERVIVSDQAGTTRDSIDVDFKYYNKWFTLIDTAGIRRKGKIQGIEKYSVLRAEGAIAKSNIILLVLDGSMNFTEQDEVIGGLASKANIPTIIVVNKIDLLKDKSDKSLLEIKKQIRNKFKHLFWSPIIFVSALENKKIHQIFKIIELVQKEVQIKISTSILNDVIGQAQMLQQAPLFKGARINITYATQVKSRIPTFTLFCSHVDSLHFSYARYIENKIRDAFNLKNTPITLYWKDKNSRVRGEKYE